jgi:hypothetical protein
MIDSLEPLGLEPALVSCEPLPAPPRIVGIRQPSDRDLIQKTRREALLEAYDALRQDNPQISLRRAARVLGTPLVNLHRLTTMRADKKDLTPRNRFAGRHRKHPDLAALLEIESIRTKLDSLYVSTLGASSEAAASGRRTGVVSVTLERFAEEPECPPDLAARLMTGQQPKQLIAYLRRITPEVEARIRGEKNYKLNGIVSRRDDTVRLPDGRRGELVSGYLVEFDDMSANQPFYVELPGGKVALSRQGLYARDKKSGRWLGVELIARPREAYRAEDILRFMRRLMSIYGKFSVLRLERGIWGARSLKGYRVTETGSEEEQFERPGMDQTEQAKLQQGLEAIGIRIQYVTSAHRKGSLESSFRYLQTVLATYTTDLNNMGRYAGEFETVAKRIRQARAESHHPAALKFAHIDVLAERIERAMCFINRRARGGDLQDTADAEWVRDMAVRELPHLTELDLAAFLPDVRELSIKGGRVVTTIDGVTHDFRSDMFAELGHGYRLFVKLDPGEPTLGAAIYNRETSSANHLQLKLGEFICFARWEMPGPQLEAATPDGLNVVTTQQLYGVGPDRDEGYGNRQRQDKYVRTAFRGLPKPGQPSIKVAEVRDGVGNFARVTQDAGNAAAAPQPQLPAPKPASSRRGAIPAAPTQDQFARKQARLAEEAEAARRLREMQES